MAINAKTKEEIPDEELHDPSSICRLCTDEDSKVAADKWLQNHCYICGWDNRVANPTCG